MRHKFLCTLGLMIVAWVGFAANPAGAATTAAGPYYANPSWDQQLPASTRFVVLSNWIDAANPAGGAAVLDRETGLVWEISPSTSGFGWEDAQSHCNGLRTGNRLGWRLPTIQELASLVDPTVPTAPGGLSLPAGHPFMNVQSGSSYWSATTSAVFFFTGSPAAWAMDFRFGAPLQNFALGSGFNGTKNNVWCVRGGQGVDSQ